MRELLMIAVGSALVNNVVLSQFLGLCPFLGVSKKMDTAAGMGAAVIFVLTISSFCTSLIYKFVLVTTGMEYMQTIVFILVIAALVQLVEMFLKKTMPALYMVEASKEQIKEWVQKCFQKVKRRGELDNLSCVIVKVPNKK